VTARRRGIGVVAKESVRSPNTHSLTYSKAMTFNGFQGLKGLGGFDHVGNNTYQKQNMKATQEVNEG